MPRNSTPHRDKRRNPVGVDPRRVTRHEQAVERQAAYDALTPDEKLAQIDSRRGKSARERARVMKEADKDE